MLFKTLGLAILVAPTVLAGAIGQRDEPSSTISTVPASTLEPTTTSVASVSSTTSITTPLPTQSGMVANCNNFHLVQKDEDCAVVASKYKITVAEFQAWNPAVGSDCKTLWANTYACVDVVGHVPTPTTTTFPNGIPTPQPTQSGMVTNCNKFEYVKSGDSCGDIARKYGLTIAEFVKLNAGIGTDCNSMQAYAYACVGTLSAFQLNTRYHDNCTGEIHNNVTVADGSEICIDTGCAAASLEVLKDGMCPDGQVQISYWENPGCSGKWFGYGYASRGQCRALWTGGWKFKSLHFRCAKEQDDCVSQKQCDYSPEPAGNLC